MDKVFVESSRARGGFDGPNGSGKSTFLKALTGIWPPTSGEVLWKGEKLLEKNRQEISKTISLVPQHSPLPFEFTVTEVVSMGRYAHQDLGSSLVDRALITVDAWHLKERRMNHLSFGERQRVFIARALVTESPILLLDEPASSLDIRHQLEIWQLLHKLKAEGKVVVITTHDLAATKRFCDEIALLSQGKCLAKGPFQKVMTPEILKEVFGVVQTNGSYTL